MGADIMYVHVCIRHVPIRVCESVSLLHIHLGLTHLGATGPGRTRDAVSALSM